MEIKKTVENARQIIYLAVEEEWSEEELAKAVKLLHSEIADQLLSVSFLPTDETVL